MFFIDLIRSILLFRGSYSTSAFLDPLTSEEEERYIDLKDTDSNARNKLIEHNLRLVAHIAKKYDSKKVDNDDLISIGTIGLIKGVDTYKKNHNVKITTYCARCIDNEILMYFRKNNKYNNDISINEPIGYDKDGNPIEILDVIKMEDVDFSDDLELKDNIKLLNKYLSVLTNREKEIIIDRYGLDNKKSLTQKMISKKLNISRSYVSRIEKRALTKLLREFIKDKRL
jgi:RNA polymerase sporulation-specific sigma factor